MLISILIAIIGAIASIYAEIQLAQKYGPSMPDQIVTRPKNYPGESRDTVMSKKAALRFGPYTLGIVGLICVVLAVLGANPLVQIGGLVFQGILIFSVRWICRYNSR